MYGKIIEVIYNKGTFHIGFVFSSSASMDYNEVWVAERGGLVGDEWGVWGGGVSGDEEALISACGLA